MARICVLLIVMMILGMVVFWWPRHIEEKQRKEDDVAFKTARDSSANAEHDLTTAVAQHERYLEDYPTGRHLESVADELIALQYTELFWERIFAEPTRTDVSVLANLQDVGVKSFQREETRDPWRNQLREKVQETIELRACWRSSADSLSKKPCNSRIRDVFTPRQLAQARAVNNFFLEVKPTEVIEEHKRATRAKSHSGQGGEIELITDQNTRVEPHSFSQFAYRHGWIPVVEQAARFELSPHIKRVIIDSALYTVLGLFLQRSPDLTHPCS